MDQQDILDEIHKKARIRKGTFRPNRKRISGDTRDLRDIDVTESEIIVDTANGEHKFPLFKDGALDHTAIDEAAKVAREAYGGAIKAP